MNQRLGAKCQVSLYKMPYGTWYTWFVDNIIINTVLLGFVLASHIVICNSDTTSNTSDRSNTNTKSSNTSTVS